MPCGARGERSEPETEDLMRRQSRELRLEVWFRPAPCQYARGQRKRRLPRTWTAQFSQCGGSSLPRWTSVAQNYGPAGRATGSVARIIARTTDINAVPATRDGSRPTHAVALCSLYCPERNSKLVARCKASLWTHDPRGDYLTGLVWNVHGPGVCCGPRIGRLPGQGVH